MTKHKVVFLDRDGVLNVDHGYVHAVEAWEWLPNVPEALRLLQGAGFKLVVITNQSGIGHGLYSLEDMKILHEYVVEQLKGFGVTLDAIVYCPHARDQNECNCRKPKIGMAQQAEELIGRIDYGKSWTIGDKEIDMQFGKTAGTQTALVRSSYWQEKKLAAQLDMIVDSLWEFAQKLTTDR